MRLMQTDADQKKKKDQWAPPIRAPSGGGARRSSPKWLRASRLNPCPSVGKLVIAKILPPSGMWVASPSRLQSTSLREMWVAKGSFVALWLETGSLPWWGPESFSLTCTRRLKFQYRQPILKCSKCSEVWVTEVNVQDLERSQNWRIC